MIMDNILLTSEQFEALTRKILEKNPALETIINPSEFDNFYITNSELMSLLKVSRRTIQRWRMTGRIPFVKIGNNVYYRKDVLLKYFKMHSCGVIAGGLSPPQDYDESEEVFQPTGCERCPLFVILNS
jgi:excisionase family DNA binding protein